jgi:hypothetical protein
MFNTIAIQNKCLNSLSFELSSPVLCGHFFNHIVHKINQIMATISKELKEERDKVTFNVEEFTNWYYGGAKNVQRRREIGKHN